MKKELIKPLVQKSRNANKENVVFDLTTQIYLLIILVISLGAFPSRIRLAIKKESNGFCDVCNTYVGIKNLTAAHIVHGKDPHLNVRENGRAHCDFCEAEYHLQHALDPTSIGLTKPKNDSVIYGRILALSEADQKYLIQKYENEWAQVIGRFEKL